jgi:hypothetical protein
MTAKQTSVKYDFIADDLEVNVTFAIHSKFPLFAVKQKIIVLVFSLMIQRSVELNRWPNARRFTDAAALNKWNEQRDHIKGTGLFAMV